MLSEERRREILEVLQNDGRVLVGDLSKRFNTSLITIRKDLEALGVRAGRPTFRPEDKVPEAKAG